MVIHAYLKTSISEVVSHDLDRLHGVEHREGLVIVKQYGPFEDILFLSERILSLGEIQAPERPVLKALAGNHAIREGLFIPLMTPY